ncbi:hypothetical protein PAV_8c00540 [Paenibacillus alvei DSM 29]|nr:hypothetical protein PAV_8c00540 [Paenibacillus alvei DSM 29]
MRVKNFLSKLTGFQPAAARCILTRKVVSCRSDVLCIMQKVSSWEYYVDRDTGEVCSSQTKVRCGC